MHLRIWHKLFLAFLMAAALVVVMVLLLTRFSFNRGFIDYMNQLETERLAELATELSGHYAEQRSWDAFIDNPALWRDVLKRTMIGSGRWAGGRGRPRTDHDRPRREDGRPQSDDNRTRPDNGRPRPPGFGRQGLRVDLLDADGGVIRGRETARPSANRYPIEVDDIVVGFLRYVPISTLTDLSAQADQRFVRGQRRGLWVIAGLTLLVVAALALLMARQLVAPVRALNRGAKAIARGDLDQRIEVRGHDELGQLATDFNAMAKALGDMQAARRQWIVDISHELRTPLAILGGELQALEDGVRQWDTDARHSLQSEVDRLSRLVNDLHELSLSDAGGMSYTLCSINLIDVVDEALDTCRTRMAERNLSVHTDLPDDPVLVRGDARRLTQMLINLLENSVRYTDAGGQVRVRCHARGPTAHLTIEDSAPGVSDEAMPHLFERLYRVDASRNRGTGGSGLGLAICQAVVAAHGGEIGAGNSELGGLRIHVELPREQ